MINSRNDKKINIEEPSCNFKIRGLQNNHRWGGH